MVWQFTKFSKIVLTQFAIFGVKDIRHSRNLPVSFTVFTLEVESMFLNLSKSEGFYTLRSTQYDPFIIPNLCKGESYTFTIEDAYNDGICCGYGQGNYTVNVLDSANTVIEEFTGGSFTSSDTLSFTIGTQVAPTCDLDCSAELTMNLQIDQYGGETNWILAATDSSSNNPCKGSNWSCVSKTLCSQQRSPVHLWGSRAQSLS